MCIKKTIFTKNHSSSLTISSLQNDKIKRVRRLREKRWRDRCGETIIEGYRELFHAIRHAHFPTLLFYCPAFFLGTNEEKLLEETESNGTLLLETTQNVFKKIAYRDRPDGLLGIAPCRVSSFDDLQLKSSCALVLVAESIEKPGNLGAMIRSADGVGVDAVIVCDKTTDLNNPNVIRASVGMVFTMPVIESTVSETVEFLRKNQIQVIAAVPAAEKMFWEADITKPTAIVVGSEQYGLSSLWLDAAYEQVRIPMLGNADSLNVATAATLMLYEALRQRRGSIQ